jgi:hypothetical protein
LDHEESSLFPFLQGEWYTVRDLREIAATILHRTGSDKEFAAAMRVNDQKAYPWAKAWMEEIFPAWRLAEELGLGDGDGFKWTPVGAADIEFRSRGRTIKIQCTMGYAERGDTVAKQGGHLRKLEMEQSNATGMVWLGGAVTEPKTVDRAEDRETWRVGVATAIRKKLKPDYRGCSLLVYAPLCQFNLIDGDDFRDVIIAAADRVGRTQWGAVFERLYVLDSPSGAFVELLNDA